MARLLRAEGCLGCLGTEQDTANFHCKAATDTRRCRNTPQGPGSEGYGRSGETALGRKEGREWPETEQASFGSYSEGDRDRGGVKRGLEERKKGSLTQALPREAATSHDLRRNPGGRSGAVPGGSALGEMVGGGSGERGCGLKSHNRATKGPINLQPGVLGRLGKQLVNC